MIAQENVKKDSTTSLVAQHCSKAVPLCMTTSSSASSSEDDDSPCLMEKDTSLPLAGLISPQATCSQRALSIPITNDHAGNDTVNTTSSRLAKQLTIKASSPSNDYSMFQTTPAPMRAAAWAEGVATDFLVRGANYPKLNKKVPSQPSVFDLFAVDMVLAPSTVYSGVCSRKEERIQLALEREKVTGEQQLPNFIFAVNLCIPAGSAGRKGGCYHFVSYFGIDDKSILTDTSKPEGKLTNQFFFGEDDTFRDTAFKLIPRIVEGNFVVRKAVGSKPSLLGTKLKLHYVRTERFCEVLVDIASDSVAQKIVKLALGYAKNLTVDMMFLFEGKDETTLPERILGGVRVCNVDFKDKDGQRLIN